MPSARAASTVRGSCTIKTKKKQRIATCMIRLGKSGWWLVSITPVQASVKGTPATTRVEIKKPVKRSTPTSTRRLLFMHHG